MFDWQAIVVTLIIAGALLYAGRRAVSRLRSFRTTRPGDVSDCATGCGKCGGDETAPARTFTPVVQISRTRTPDKNARS